MFRSSMEQNSRRGHMHEEESQTLARLIDAVGKWLMPACYGLASYSSSLDVLTSEKNEEK